MPPYHASPDNLLPAMESSVWTTWAALPQFAARSGVERVDFPTGTALALHADHAETYGRWMALTAGIVPARYYEASVWQRTRGVDFENLQTPLLLSWFDAKGEELQRDYIDEAEAAVEKEWRKRRRTLQAPDGARSVRVELGLRWKAGVSVWWAAPCLRETAPPPARKVRIATTRLVPPRESTVEANMRQMADLFDRVGAERPDIVLFSENLVDRHVHRPVAEVAQPIPGPLTEMLSEKARRHHAYVATTLHEVDPEGRFYNTAVLIDREGAVVGTYRKTHLTLNEADRGVLPGNDCGVFDTDFGRVGILTCWDNWFPEMARLLRLRGAEILLLPIAGDGVPGHWEAVSRARAFDNGVYLVSSSTLLNPSQIINPAGEVVAEATGGFGCVVHEIDLNQQWRVRYLSAASGLGEGRSLYVQERRPDLYRPLSE